MRILVDQAIPTGDYKHMRFNHFAICTDDRPRKIRRLPTFYFCGDGERIADEYLVPDFVYDSWPEIGFMDYETEREKLIRARWKPSKQKKIGWIGSLLTPDRMEAFDIAKCNKNYIDMREINWQRQPSGKVVAANSMSFLDQQREWYALLDLAGHGWSARLKILFSMGRPLLIQQRPWTEWWHAKLIPDVHYAPVRRDLKDLVDVATRVIYDLDYAQALALNSAAFADELLTRKVAHQRLRTTLLNQNSLTLYAQENE